MDPREEEKKQEDFPIHEYKGRPLKERSTESKLDEIPDDFDMIPLIAPRG